MTCHLYLISPPSLNLPSFADQLAAALTTGAVAAFQLRLKEVSDETIRQAVATLMPLCHRHDVPLILNDRVDLAVSLNTDGVHIGGQDSKVSAARAALDEGKTLGVSCYDSIDLAADAGEAGADYVSFGTFFPSKTKQSQGKPTLETLRWWHCNSVLPCVAIGGINAQNAGELAKAGADFVAVISAVWEHPQGAAAGVESIHRTLCHSHTYP